MIFDLNEKEAINLIKETETLNARSFVNDCLNYNVNILDVLKVIETYLIEFEPPYITDARNLINGGGWAFFNSAELKDINANDYYNIEIKPGVFLLIE